MKARVLGYAGIALGVAFTAMPVRAADAQLECRYRIERVLEKVQRTVDKYGKDSSHALRVQGKLEEVHEWCWRRYRGWWDEHDQRWRTDHS